MTTSGANRAWLPNDVDQLLVLPLAQESIAAQVSTVRTGLTGNAFRVPLVTADPTAAWVAEGAEIPASDATLSEAASDYRKLAGLTIVSRELAEDSDPAAAEEIGRGLVRDLSRKLDSAYFGSNTGVTATTPAGLLNVTGVSTEAAPLAPTNLDPWLAARFNAAAAGTEVGAFVMNAAEAELLAGIKEGTASNRRLVDTAGAPALTIEGVPVLISTAIANNVTWALPKDRVYVAIRQGAEVEMDRSVFFTSDRVAVRATLRATFAFPHPAAITKITRA